MRDRLSDMILRRASLGAPVEVGSRRAEQVDIRAAEHAVQGVMAAGEMLLANTRDACRVRCYAPGLFEGDGTSPEAMRELTGFRLVRVSPANPRATPTGPSKELGLQT